MPGVSVNSLVGQKISCNHRRARVAETREVGVRPRRYWTAKVPSARRLTCSPRCAVVMNVPPANRTETV